MSSVQDSLDHLLHAATDERISYESIVFYYVVKWDANLNIFNNNPKEAVVISITVSGSTIHISFEEWSDEKFQGDSGITPIVIENKYYEIIQSIENLYEVCSSCSTSNICNRGSAIGFLKDTASTMMIPELFLRVIHGECMNNSELTAKKLIELHYPLWQVVILGNPEVIEHMILNGCPVDSRDSEKSTAIHKAVKYMDLGVLKILMKYGASVDLMDKCKKFPIAYYHPRYQPYYPQVPEIIRILLNTTVLLKDLNQQELFDQFQNAFWTGNKEVIQMLLEFGDDKDILNATDMQNRTPLHCLFSNPHSDVIELLQGREIDVNKRGPCGQTPLFIHCASTCVNIQTIKFLLKNGADVNVQTLYLNTALLTLCNNTFVRKSDYFEIIKIFLQHGLDIQCVDYEQMTVFDEIIRNKRFYLAEPLLAQLAIMDESEKPITDIIRNKIESHKILKDCFDQCKAEIAEMKSFIIINEISFYMILVNQVSEEKTLKIGRFSQESLLKFKELREKIQPENHYYTAVQKCISSIASKLELLQEAVTIICKVFQPNIDCNHIVINKIVDYIISTFTKSF